MIQKLASKPDAFARTYQDDYKLKITCLPITIDVPIDLPPPFFSAEDKNPQQATPKLDSVRTKLETFSYPSWERYMIEKIKP